MRFSSFLFIQLLLLTIIQPSIAQKNGETEAEGSPVILNINRYLGYRSADDVTSDSDYSFIVRTDYSWTFRPMQGKSQFFGKLDMSGISKLSEVTESVSKIEPVDPNKPRIADVPKISISVHSGKDKIQRELGVRSESGKKLHEWILTVRDLESPDVIKQLKFAGKKRGGRFDASEVVTSTKELEAALSGDILKKIGANIDFEKQQVILFQWAGSGQDRIEAHLESGDKNSTLIVKLKRGRTRDLRPHGYAFVIPKGTEVKVE